MGWFIGDSCDVVKPNLIEERFNEIPSNMYDKLA